MIKSISITRDNKIRDLENSLIQQMLSIVNPPAPEVKNNVKDISFEDALKELLTLEK